MHFQQFTKSQSNISGDTIKERKPHPAPMLLASKEIGVAAEHIWFLGDAKRDIDAGNAASMTTIAVKWGYIKPFDDCAKWQANHIISNPLDLVGISK